MVTAAPKPRNFDALADAWNDPERFALELHAYYEQLVAEQPRAAVDFTEPRRSPDGAR